MIQITRRQWVAGFAVMVAATILEACGETAPGVTPAAGTMPTAPAPPPTAASAMNPTTAAPSAISAMNATSAAPAMTTAASAVSPAGTTAPAMAVSTAMAPASNAAAGKVQSQINTAGIMKGGSVIVAASGDVTGFNPVTEGNVVTNSIMPLLFDALIFTDPDTLQPTPNLATKWDISPDGKTYTFTLKQGVKWHDGMPFTADDVKFSYDLFTNPESGSIRAGSLGQNIAAVDVKDPTTVVFTLKDVVASFLAIDMTYGILPKHILAGVPAKEFLKSDFNVKKPVGTGPFVFKEQQLGDHLTLTGNRDYHRGATALDQYIYKVVKDTNVQLQQLKTGELDVVASVSQDAADEAKRQPNLNVTDYDTFTMLLFGYNLDPQKGPEIFRDVRVRQALCYVQDRETIAKKVYNGYATVAVGTQPPLSWAAQPDKITMKYPYDPNKAAALLDEAGWKPGPDGVRVKDGKRLSFTLYTVTGSTVAQNHVSVVQEALKQVGVDMQLRFEEGSLVVNRAAKSFDYEMFHFSLSPTPEPDQTRYFASNQHGPGANYYGYSNPKVDDLLQRGVRTLDQEQRKAIYLDAQNQIVTDMPVFITHFLKGIGAVNKRVRNLVPNTISTNFNAHQWYVTDGK